MSDESYRRAPARRSFPMELTTITQNEVYAISGAIDEISGRELTNWEMLGAIANRLYGQDTKIIIGGSFRVNDLAKSTSNGSIHYPVLVVENKRRS